MAISKAELSIIIQNLNKERNVEFTICEDYDKKYLAEYMAMVLLNNNEEVQIAIAFAPHFPLSLPDIFVKDNVSFRAHVGSEGKLCLFDSSAILIKQELADQFVIDCFDQAVKILNIRPGSKVYNDEVCREFDSYWLSVMNKKAYSCLDLQDIRYGEYPMVVANGVRVIANTKNEAEVLLRNTFGFSVDKDAFERTCLVVRIRDGSMMMPLSKQFRWNAVRRYVLDNTSSSVKRQFRKFLGNKVKHFVRYLLLVYPAKEGDILFGFRIEFNNSRYCKIENSQTCKVENAFIERIDYQYLTMRGGATPILKDKRVLLLGCGSVGGYIASNLCQSGVMNVDILDDDFFQPENVHRHWLGFDSISPKEYKYKANLMREKLQAQYPYADIAPLNFVDRSAESFISDTSNLAHYDLIISALGEPTINLEINRILNDNSIEVPFMCCFNEPYGIGGHVMAVNLDENSCLQCLYTDSISNELVPFRGSFAEPHQNFKKIYLDAVVHLCRIVVWIHSKQLYLPQEKLLTS
ncbi:MAG: ThiF family adenylyltransferase [Desulfosporosinus sp.]|nr:ThiF family adenylyltransferase [Desulfosporosinus sp.]